MDLIDDPFAVDDEGFVAPREAPGLGITIDESFLAAHRVDGSGKR